MPLTNAEIDYLDRAQQRELDEHLEELEEGDDPDEEYGDWARDQEQDR